MTRGPDRRKPRACAAENDAAENDAGSFRARD
jgi:hypothetical protein